MAEFVPPDFEVPLGLETSEFVLEPLGPEHNERDYDAWTSSMGHIAATAGYPDGSWPREMTRDENRVDLQRHADDFRTRKEFTYTVLDPASRDVIGCVYIYPLPDSVRQRRVRAPHVGPAKQPSRWDRFGGRYEPLRPFAVTAPVRRRPRAHAGFVVRRGGRRRRQLFRIDRRCPVSALRPPRGSR